MPVEPVIAPEAELDIAEAYEWYEGRRAGLGEEFLGRRLMPSKHASIELVRRVLRSVGDDLCRVSYLSRSG
jgi:hypothetical protein